MITRRTSGFCICKHAYISTCIYIYVHIFTSMCMCLYICVLVYTYICIYTEMYICIYAHIQRERERGDGEYGFAK